MSQSDGQVSKRPEQAIDKLWFTRCPVPTATGLAYKLGWLDEEFARDGITVGTLQDRDESSHATPEQKRTLARHHYDHELPGLFREGGNMLALAARAQGAPSRLIGLTWIDEGQSIVVRKGSGISHPRQLKGLRVALPAYSELPIQQATRGRSIARGMALHGFKGVLTHAGLQLSDVRFVEIDVGVAEDRSSPPEQRRPSRGLEALAAGQVDAVYVKGAAAADTVQALGLEVGIHLDRLPERRFRVNNGTPRPITVHQDLVEHHFDLVVRFLYQSLRAAEWARHNLQGVRRVLQGETRGSAEGVAGTYGEGFHRVLHPDLSVERLALFEQQKTFLLLHGFLDRDFDLHTWADARPLAAAWKLLEQDQAAAAQAAVATAI
jgi:ABC-type nitrate/sulfonate/bicarbonate transport system substrate-binding protein